MKVKPLHERKEYTNMREMIEHVGEIYNGRVAYRYRNNPHDKEPITVNYEQLRDEVRALATEMITRDLKGKHVAVIGKHSYNWIRAYYSLLTAGAVMVPLDKDWNAADLTETIKTSDSVLVMCDSEQKAKCAEITSALDLPEAIYLDGDEEGTLGEWHNLGKAKFEADPSIYYGNEIDPDALALLVFTSGTTGKGKGVMLSQHNFMSDLAEVIPYMNFSVKCINVLPPHHTYGSSVSIFGQACIGSDVYISSGVKYVLKELKEHKPGHLVAVPLYVETFYRRILKGIDEKGKFVAGLMKMLLAFNRACHKIGLKPLDGFFKKKIVSNFGGELNMIISGGAPLNQDVANLFEAIGIDVLNGYGITECAPIIAVNHNNYKIPKSVGPVLAINEVKIDEPNEDGEGEILVRGSNVMLGYYKDDEANAAAFTEDGFFRTGDYGKIKIDNEGNQILFITGRLKNLIILSNGKNVYPEEIEDALSATPGLLEIIVYEGQSKRGLEHNAIVAEIYADKDYLDKNGITDAKAYFDKFVQEYNKTAVAYKKVAIVKIRDEEFPKNTLRKILRRMIDMTID